MASKREFLVNTRGDSGFWTLPDLVIARNSTVTYRQGITVHFFNFKYTIQITGFHSNSGTIYSKRSNFMILNNLRNSSLSYAG